MTDHDDAKHTARRRFTVIRKEQWLSKNSEAYRCSFPSEEGLKLECEAHDWYTLNASGEFQGHDTQLLKYLHTPVNYNAMNINLMKHSYEIADRCSLTSSFSGNLNHLFQWIMSCDKGKQLLESSNFICSRGSIDNVLGLPYRPIENNFSYGFSLTLSAVKLGGKVYMVRKETDAHKQHEMQMISIENYFNCQKEDLKFKQYMLRDFPNSKSGKSQPLELSKQEIRVVTTLPFGGYNILYTSNLQGMPDSQAVNDITSASLSLLATQLDTKDENFPWYILLGWWIQASTKKTDKILVGRVRRTDSTRVVKTITVIPKAGLIEKCAHAYNNRRDKTHQNSLKKNKRQERKKRVGIKENCRGVDLLDWRSGEPMKNPQPSPPRAGASSSEISADDMSSMCLLSLKRFLDFVWEMTEPGIVLDFTWDIQDKDHMSCEPSQDSFIPQWFIEWINSNNL